MPARIFLLARFFLRLDDVICRVRDTRICVEFETGAVMRDYSSMERPYSELKKVGTVLNMLSFVDGARSRRLWAILEGS
jgi:hypothetical protein